MQKNRRPKIEDAAQDVTVIRNPTALDGAPASCEREDFFRRLRPSHGGR